MADRIISPQRRRIVEKAKARPETVAQLKLLGWDDYEGPAEVTSSDQHIALNGWIIFGSDRNVDAERRERTGTFSLAAERR